MPLSRPQAFGDGFASFARNGDSARKQPPAGSTAPTSAALERAVKTPRLTTVWRIADGFETQPSELLARTERLLD